jgi:hypothetical protein
VLVVIGPLRSVSECGSSIRGVRQPPAKEIAVLQPNRLAGSSVPPEPVPTFEGRPLPDPTEPAWDQGLAFDVETRSTDGGR